MTASRRTIETTRRDHAALGRVPSLAMATRSARVPVSSTVESSATPPAGLLVLLVDATVLLLLGLGVQSDLVYGGTAAGHTPAGEDLVVLAALNELD